MRNITMIGTLLALLVAAAPAAAQILPMSSGEPSFSEPEMRPHRSGLYRPNRPHHRSHRRHARRPYGAMRSGL